FYDPSDGSVLLDGHNIKSLNVKWLRSLFGFVQQEPVLFNISIKTNIAYGDNTKVMTDKEIETVARIANIHEFIIALPKGYDTVCGSKGSQLSGGEKQRISIARALVRNPMVILFDEATSALDSQSEKLVQDAVYKAQSNRTSLTIAHRLSTIQNSDKIIVVNHGRVREEGTHKELLNEKGIYSRLLMAQEKQLKRFL
ncbi:unnamed protein product, partial [Didymodactylos carnosus]